MNEKERELLSLAANLGYEVTKKEAEKLIEPVKNPDWTKVIKACKEYVEFRQSKDYCDDTDLEHYLFEDTLKAVYGNDIFDRLN